MAYELLFKHAKYQLPTEINSKQYVHICPICINFNYYKAYPALHNMEYETQAWVFDEKQVQAVSFYITFLVVVHGSGKEVVSQIVNHMADQGYFKEI